MLPKSCPAKMQNVVFGLCDSFDIEKNNSRLRQQLSSGDQRPLESQC